MNTIEKETNQREVGHCDIYGSTTFNSRNLAKFISDYYFANGKARFVVNFQLIERNTIKAGTGPKSDEGDNVLPFHIVCDFDTFLKLRNSITTPKELYKVGNKLKKKKDHIVLLGEKTNIFDPERKGLHKQFTKDDSLYGALLDLAQAKALDPDKDEKEILGEYLKQTIAEIRKQKNAQFTKINN